MKGASMSDKQDGISIGIGMSTFMMIFTVLCLTIFATLTYLQARHNQQETDKIIESTVAYYDADHTASKIYKELKTQYTDTTFLEDNGIEKEGNTYSYTVSISENRELKVTIEENEGKLNIIQWQEIAQSNDDYDYQGFVN
jgi:uncharacterized protein YxeA